jgi:Na+/H+-dicarboxylate symporter
MARPVGRTVLKLVLWSLIVGLALSVLNVSPAAILGFLGETAEGIFAWVVGVVEWAVPYLVLGAAVVLPIWLIMAAWRFLRSKNG